MVDRIVPEIVAKRRPTSDQHARELYRLGSDWQAYRWEAEGDRETGYLQLTGGVFREVYKKGKRKGEPNYNKPEPGTLRTVTIPNVLHREWRAQWERDTGHCANCEGTGQEWWGWSAKDGVRYRPCVVCGASGIARLVDAEIEAV